MIICTTHESFSNCSTYVRIVFNHEKRCRGLGSQFMWCRYGTVFCSKHAMPQQVYQKLDSVVLLPTI